MRITYISPTALPKCIYPGARAPLESPTKNVPYRNVSEVVHEGRRMKKRWKVGDLFRPAGHVSDSNKRRSVRARETKFGGIARATGRTAASQGRDRQEHREATRQFHMIYIYEHSRHLIAAARCIRL